MARFGRVVVSQTTKYLIHEVSWAVTLTTLIILGGCRFDENANDRVVDVLTTACGATSHTSGLGIVVGDRLILTAAHVVVGAGSITVGGSDDKTHVADVVVLDTARDLAVLRSRGVGASPIKLGYAVAGDVLSVPLPNRQTIIATVTRPVTIHIDDVRATTRSTRAGYELHSNLISGDSGAGLFDGQERLVGVFFSRSLEREVGYAVGAKEIEVVLGKAHESYECDVDASLVVRRDG